MLVRVQSSDGTRRITASPTDTLKTFLDKVIVEFKLGKTENFSLCREHGGKGELSQEDLRFQLKSIPISHGDMLYLIVKGQSSPESSEVKVQLEEDEVDRILSKKDGLVHRQRDSQLCRHGPMSKCVNCMALEPWDKAVQEGRETIIKHLSFHCYTRKLTSGVDKGKFADLEDLSCKIRSGCKDHAPWPAGICTKCQPSAITLARQPYRHVDNVMFEDGAIVDRFLNSWRQSGGQRLGYLIGHYEEYNEVPLGIRAVVSAIYEPPQMSLPHSVELLEDTHKDSVEELAALLGLRKVGWIFTDLESEGNGKVAYKRSINTHILSAEECVMAAEFQNTHPNPCKLNKTGQFGSKFITVCVSGNESNQIDLKGYQVSNQCMALVRDDCLVPTLDAPELGFVRESSNEQYVPDVFYKAKDSYGEVTRLARPLPLEYLIIELTTSHPKNPQPLLPGGKGHFPVENRFASTQDFNSLCEYVRQQQGVHFLNYMSDFHLLLYLHTNDVAGIRLKAHLGGLCEAIRHGNKALSDNWKSQDVWATVEQLITASSEPSPTGLAPPTSLKPLPTSSSGSWQCKHCTLLNPSSARDCEACHLPK